MHTYTYVRKLHIICIYVCTHVRTSNLMIVSREAKEKQAPLSELLMYLRTYAQGTPINNFQAF